MFFWKKGLLNEITNTSIDVQRRNDKKKLCCTQCRKTIELFVWNSEGKKHMTQHFYSCLRCHSGTKAPRGLENHLLLMTMKPNQTRNQQRNCWNEDILGKKKSQFDYESIKWRTLATQQFWV